jgi:phytoene synthase
MSGELDQSYTHCQRLAYQSATNFYYSFLALPRIKRRSMYALYAFLRRTDDLGDNDRPLDERRQALVAWRRALAEALEGRFADPIFPALADSVARFRIPTSYLSEVIDGVEMDLAGRHYDTFEELSLYCHRVAGVVGLACLHIWGFRGEEAFAPALKCGLAFQLTNILRDLKEDAEAGRIYLPAEDLRRFAYTPDELRRGVRDSRFSALMRFQIERAEQLYREGAELEPWLEPDGRGIFGAMTAMYRGLLDQIRRRDGDVFTSRVRLSGWQRLRIAARWLVRPALFPSRSAVPTP